jgi:hypothetical protein
MQILLSFQIGLKQEQLDLVLEIALSVLAAQLEKS